MADSYETIVIGGGQAGLATGYHLQHQGLEFVILDASDRIGDAWRNRWDSLRVFTTAPYTSLPGFPFPGDRHSFPTKDEVADYLELYASWFDLPIELGVAVECVERNGEKFRVTAGDRTYNADNVVIAMSSYQVPSIPSFAEELDPTITQLHSKEYRNPDQLQEGDVLVVGASDSGAEISLDIAGEHRTWLSGRDVGHVPFHIDSAVGRYLGVPFVMRVLFHRILTTGTPIGRRLRPQVMSQAAALVRTKPEDFEEAGIERVPRTVGVQNGQPVVEGGRVLDVQNVIWCTGYQPDFSWIDLPVFDGDLPKEPLHERGVVPNEPGLYFVGLFFLHAVSSSLFVGVGRDAAYVVDHVASRTASDRSSSRLPLVSTHSETR